MIKLYQFPGFWGLPNASPFCLKLETYLRLADIPYEIKFLSDPRKAPKGKLPFIKIDDKTIADSEIIIDFLKGKLGDQLDGNLRKEQRALSVVLDSSFAERLYWIIVYMRWQYEPNWVHVKSAFFAKLPLILKLFLPNIVRKSTLKALHNQGMGRHSYDEVLEMGYKFLDAIADILGDKKYFLGDEPSTIDATAFALLANIAWTPYDDALKTHLAKHKNLLSYCDKMWSTFYPELAKPFMIVP
ncbi:hypothetical protein BN59_01353 [Legionella massiliensis]|uniref:GST N-terminal domain-containing protein n=1 Tax=Legionella massiliensis TaxID=1034943 RepID=A0A078KZ81_9GAMM|nr:glutathione S-transferase family protein [Legionella massiliensis]CDZ77074.1 hypothetical protein BN59_01353 [Legionella massiliensis]CEE12812.1 hypothetical protein BN1094_01353 [Legionella massiliensis]